MDTNSILIPMASDVLSYTLESSSRLELEQRLGLDPSAYLDHLTEKFFQPAHAANDTSWKRMQIELSGLPIR